MITRGVIFFSTLFLFQATELVLFKNKSVQKGCGILILVDETVMDELDDSRRILRKILDKAVRDLNDIFRSKLFAGDFNVFFYIERVVLMKNFIPKCEDGNVSGVE